MSNSRFWPEQMRDSDRYAQWHRQTLLADSRRFSLVLRDWGVLDGKLYLNDPLHPGWAYLYQLLFRLKPASLYDFGCGSMNHLENVRRILPGIRIAACELSEAQVRTGEELFGLRREDFNVTVGDFLGLEIPGKYDLVMSQTCLMHLPGPMIEPALRKMNTIAEKYLLCMDWFWEGYDTPAIENLLGEFGAVERIETDAMRAERRNHSSMGYAYLVTKGNLCSTGPTA